VVGVSLPPADACTYWCMNPATRQYVCCDEGNPWYNGGSEEPAAEEIGDGAVVADYVVDSGLVDGADAGSSSGCVYYCNYNSQVYCCDSGEGPPPSDHEDNAGRCPTEEEQSCKVSSDDKKPEVKISSIFVGKHNDMCASDGYCAEEEKCCPSKCHKKHTCMPSL